MVITKSTVPVGSADIVREQIQGALDKRNEKIDFYVASNPEFLKEGASIAQGIKSNHNAYSRHQ